MQTKFDIGDTVKMFSEPKKIDEIRVTERDIYYRLCGQWLPEAALELVVKAFGGDEKSQT